jgi:ATP-dependent helicase/nuclease subunit A
VIQDDPENGIEVLETRGQLGLAVEQLDRGDLQRPGGRRFGALVHALLSAIDLNAEADAIRTLAANSGRVFDATEEEVNAAAVIVGKALAHPILRRAGASAAKGNVRRETPVLLSLDDGSVVEGVVDLAFREDMSDFNGWTVVDFKTAREFKTSSRRYIEQVKLYSNAIRAVTGLPSRGVVLVL